MRLPKMAGGSAYRVTVPALNGGVNLQDAPHLVGDNQLTDACNVWWKEQALRTRPGLETEETKLYRNLDSYSGRFTVLPDFAHESSLWIDNGDFGQTFSIFDNSGHYAASRLSLTPGDERFISSLCVRCSNIQDERLSGIDYLVFSASVFSALPSPSGEETEKKQENGTILGIQKSMQAAYPSAYLPLVTVNGRGTDSDLYDANKPNGTLLEGYNLLTTGFRAGFTSDGKGSRFVLPQHNLSDKAISISYAQGELTQIWTIPYGQTESNWVQLHFTDEETGACEVKFTVSRADGVLQTWIRENADVNPGQWQKKALPSGGVNNDIVITAYGADDAAARRSQLKICKMRVAQWFGGDRSGVNGGTRLFVSGNPDYPNLVHWSDTNNPLYFPENNYAYVGEANQAITAFGKQSDMLVIFKEREMYYTNYVAGSAFSAKDVIDGKITDVTAYTAQFPLTQIHTGIGCDCPHTIQLCNNRLVWADSNGRVYSLVSATPYSERNIRELSGMIGSRLKAMGRETLKKATSGDFDGHYVLQAGNTLFLLHYHSSGYENVASYTGKNAQRHMPWYVWDVALEDVEWECFLSADEEALLIGVKTVNGQICRLNYTFSFPAGTDTAVKDGEELLLEQQPIPAMFQTKAFDFGRPERRKTIRKLHIGAAGEGDIRLAYVTERGIQSDAQRLEDSGSGGREWTMTPAVNRVRRFGLRVESEGPMAVDHLVLKYEVNGEVR